MNSQILSNRQWMNLSIFALVTIIGFSMFGCVLPQVGSEAEKHLEQGKTAYEKGDYDQAIADLTKAIELMPQDYDSYLIRAEAYFAQADLEKKVGSRLITRKPLKMPLPITAKPLNLHLNLLGLLQSQNKKKIARERTRKNPKKR